MPLSSSFLDHRKRLQRTLQFLMHIWSLLTVPVERKQGRFGRRPDFVFETTKNIAYQALSFYPTVVIFFNFEERSLNICVLGLVVTYVAVLMQRKCASDQAMNQAALWIYGSALLNLVLLAYSAADRKIEYVEYILFLHPILQLGNIILYADNLNLHSVIKTCWTIRRSLRQSTLPEDLDATKFYAFRGFSNLKLVVLKGVISLYMQGFFSAQLYVHQNDGRFFLALLPLALASISSKLTNYLEDFNDETMYVTRLKVLFALENVIAITIVVFYRNLFSVGFLYFPIITLVDFALAYINLFKRDCCCKCNLTVNNHKPKTAGCFFFIIALCLSKKKRN